MGVREGGKAFRDNALRFRRGQAGMAWEFPLTRSEICLREGDT